MGGIFRVEKEGCSVCNQQTGNLAACDGVCSGRGGRLFDRCIARYSGARPIDRLPEALNGRDKNETQSRDGNEDGFMHLTAAGRRTGLRRCWNSRAGRKTQFTRGRPTRQ